MAGVKSRSVGKADLGRTDRVLLAALSMGVSVAAGIVAAGLGHQAACLFTR